MRPIFRDLVIAAVGDVPATAVARPADWTDTKISQWVALRKGKFVRGAAQDATILVCSKEEFQRGGAIVTAAKKVKHCDIVKWEWLDDCMQDNKKLSTEKYSHLAELRKKRALERRQNQVREGLKKAVREVDPNRYHLYRDHTFFEYEVVLMRDVEETGTQEKYVLTLHESNNSKPHLYWFVAKFSKFKGDPQPKIHRPSHAPGVFAREFAHFEVFFMKKAGIAWNMRLVKAGSKNKKLFQYGPPTGGKPVGWVPKQYIPTEASNVTAIAGAAATDGKEADSSKVVTQTAKLPDSLVSQSHSLMTLAPPTQANPASITEAQWTLSLPHRQLVAKL